MDEMWRRQMRDDRLRSLHFSPTLAVDGMAADAVLTLEHKGTLGRATIQAGVAWVLWWVLGWGFGSSSKVLGGLEVISGCPGS